jgi:triphosphatase
MQSRSQPRAFPRGSSRLRRFYGSIGRRRARSPESPAPSRRNVPIPIETELKLAAAPADLERLQAALAEIAAQPLGAPQRLVSTYYDTEGLALAQRGVVLRVREEDGRFTQTVKLGELDGGDFLTRGEWEDPLSEDRPDPEAPNSGAVLPAIAAADLRPVFVTDVTRRRVNLEPAPGTDIEAAVDEGEIRLLGCGRATAISEIELELKRGDAVHLYDIALRLLDVAPLRIEVRSKSERGYRLLPGGEAAAPAIRQQPFVAAPDSAVETVLQQYGRRSLAQVIRSEAEILSAEPEAVHRSRVALRRLRSVLAALKKMLPQGELRWAGEELAWLAGVFGPARNLDVLASELLPPACAALPQHQGWDELAAALDSRRHDAYDRLEQAVIGERYTAALLRLLRWFEGRGWRERATLRQLGLFGAPIGTAAPRLLDRARRRVQRRSRKFGRLTPRERHRLRIAAKQLRYTIELFAGAGAGGQARKLVPRLKQLQDELGHASDVRAAHEFTRELFAQTAPLGAVGHAWIALLEWHDHASITGERRLRRHVRRLRRALASIRAS